MGVWLLFSEGVRAWGKTYLLTVVTQETKSINQEYDENQSTNNQQ